MKSIKQLGFCGLALALFFLSGCGNVTHQITTNSEVNGVDNNTRLMYHFSNDAPAALSANTNTMLLLPFDEAVGPTAFDSSANSNNGTLSGASTFAAARFGNGISLSGAASQFVEVADNASFTYTRLSIECWIFPDTIAGTDTIVSKWGTAGNLEFNANLLAGVPRLQLSNNGTTIASFSSNTAVVVSQWTHLIFTYDGSFVSIYTNGVLTGKFAYTGPIFDSATAVRIGADSTTVGGSNLFDGIIDDVRISKTAVTPPFTTTVLDSSANLINGLLSAANISNASSPINGNYLQLTAAGQFVQANAPALAIEGPWTVEAYIRPQSLAANQVILAKGSGTAHNYGIQISSTAPANRIRVFFNDAFGNLYETYSVTQVATNTWYHVAGTWDGSSLKIYINGQLEGSVVYPAGILPVTSTAVAMNIGRDSAGTNPFGGEIDKVRISDIARTSFLNQ